MKKLFLTLLAMIVIFGALAGAGYWGYRIGYNDGATVSGNAPSFGRFYHIDPNQMPMYRFGGDFNRGFGFNRHPMMGFGGFRGIGIGMGYEFFSPFRILWNIAILALIIWFVYWLFKKSGWQIVRNVNKDQESTSK